MKRNLMVKTELPKLEIFLERLQRMERSKEINENGKKSYNILMYKI